LAVNKTEGMQAGIVTADFHELGLGEPFPISSAHGDTGRASAHAQGRQQRQFGQIIFCDEQGVGHGGKITRLNSKYNKSDRKAYGRTQQMGKHPAP
jgi:hypothetical protein